MGELLLEEALNGGDMLGGNEWSVERRFRVTEVFLAVLWVCAFPEDTSSEMMNWICSWDVEERANWK
jgi:hypothetical protein